MTDPLENLLRTALTKRADAVHSTPPTAVVAGTGPTTALADRPYRRTARAVSPLIAALAIAASIAAIVSGVAVVRHLSESKPAAPSPTPSLIPTTPAPAMPSATDTSPGGPPAYFVATVDRQAGIYETATGMRIRVLPDGAFDQTTRSADGTAATIGTDGITLRAANGQLVREIPYVPDPRDAAPDYPTPDARLRSVAFLRDGRLAVAVNSGYSTCPKYFVIEPLNATSATEGRVLLPSPTGGCSLSLTSIDTSIVVGGAESLLFVDPSTLQVTNEISVANGQSKAVTRLFSSPDGYVLGERLWDLKDPPAFDQTSQPFYLFGTTAITIPLVPTNTTFTGSWPIIMGWWTQPLPGGSAAIVPAQFVATFGREVNIYETATGTKVRTLYTRPVADNGSYGGLSVFALGSDGTLYAIGSDPAIGAAADGLWRLDRDPVLLVRKVSGPEERWDALAVHDGVLAMTVTTPSTGELLIVSTAGGILRRIAYVPDPRDQVDPASPNATMLSGVGFLVDGTLAVSINREQWCPTVFLIDPATAESATEGRRTIRPPTAGCVNAAALSGTDLIIDDQPATQSDNATRLRVLDSSTFGIRSRVDLPGAGGGVVIDDLFASADGIVLGDRVPLGSYVPRPSPTATPFYLDASGAHAISLAPINAIVDQGPALWAKVLGWWPGS